MNNTTFQILKSVLDGDALKVAQANTAYEVLNAVYDSSNEALRVNITNLSPDDGSKWEDDGETQIIPKDGKHIDASIIDNLNCVYVTHSDLQLLVASSGLQVGKKYAIYDYVPAWNIFDGGTMAIIEEQTGIGEILIATAISTNKIDSSVVSVTYPQDIIHYSLDLIDDRDIGFGDGAGTPVAHFKGMIYYRKDTIQNVETHYDFRNIKFRRWAVDVVAFDNGTAYVAKDVCKSSNGKIYKCITATTGEGDPTINAADWILWLDITADALVSWTADKTLFNIGDITADNLIINNVTAGVDYDDFSVIDDFSLVSNFSQQLIQLDAAILQGFTPTILSNIVIKKRSYLILSDVIINGCNTTINSELFAISKVQITNSIVTGDIVFSKQLVIANSLVEKISQSNIYEILNSVIGNQDNVICNRYNKVNLAKCYNVNFDKLILITANQDLRYIDCLIPLSTIDLSAATIIYDEYSKTIYQDKTDGVKLSYMDGGVPQYVAVTA